MPRRTRRRGNRVGWSNPLEFSSRPPATIDQAPDIKGLVQPSCGHAPRDSNATFIPNVVYQAWLGGGKLMFAKLLSVLSIHYIMKPQRHTIFYDEEPNDALEWRCACRLATCTPVTLRSSIFDGASLENQIATSDRYESDRLGRCANSQLDLLRIDALLGSDGTRGARDGGAGHDGGGGAFFDLDVYVLRPLEPWRRHCTAASAVMGYDRHHTGQLNPGVILAQPRSSFLAQWREGYRSYRKDTFEFGGCNQTTELAFRRQHQDVGLSGDGKVHAASEFGPLPRYSSSALYDVHLAHAPVAHLSAFRHAWRLHDIMNSRHLERIWDIVRRQINESAASNPHDPSIQDPLIRRCLRQVEGACWAKRGAKCGIYGA